MGEWTGTQDRALALTLKATIEAYWASKGKFPRVWIEPFSMSRFDAAASVHRTTQLFAVRSEMTNGCPQVRG